MRFAWLHGEAEPLSAGGNFLPGEAVFLKGDIAINAGSRIY
jgi:hypothetical protein